MPTQSPPPKQILIVEDEKPLARALELKLTQVGYKTRIASNGEEALKILETETFDIILLDLIIPKIDGFKVLTELKQRKLKTPVMVTSNLGQEEDVKRAKDLGAIDYFVKADTPLADLVSRIDFALNS